ncbi:MAG: DUF47 family protein [Candidatus Cloacimonetes bacterium]|nr:DUF47 family protein [Candidatus Cloacimonadota bacterium]
MIESKIDEFLDLISDASLIFQKGVNYYLHGNKEEFENRLKSVSEYERKADEIRVEIERNLYIHTLIPESRGDVLGIMEHTDDVIDIMKETLILFSIESPETIPELTELFEEVTEASIQGVDFMVKAVRAFFKDLQAVYDHIHKVYFYEKEADKIAEKLKRKIFKSNLELSKKLHLSRFVTSVEKVSDYAEDVCDRLSICVIKRQI